VFVTTARPRMYEQGMSYTAGGDGYPLGERHEGNRAGAQIAGVGGAQGEEAAALVEGELRLGGQVAAVEVGDERVTAVADPLDRPPDPSRRPGNQREFRTGAVADAEIAADIA